MKTAIPIFCLLLQICIVSTYAQALNRASYGQNCSKDLRCEFRSVLTCVNGICECLMPETMVFEAVSGNCVTLAGERCQYNSVEGEATWMEEVPCISNALCRNGICECDNLYYEIANGSCLPKLNHGNDCLGNKMCNGQKHLICGDDQKCTCSNNRVLSKGICIVLAGQFCLPNDTCTDHSICSASDGIPLCTCSQNYYQAKDMTCHLKKNYGEACDGHDHCIEFSSDLETQTFLVCADGKCQCNESKSILDVDGTCKKYVGQECADEVECVTGASCEGICQCNIYFYKEHENRTCQPRKSFGESCRNNAECRNNLHCDSGKNLCTCTKGNAFHPIKKECVVAVGHMCKEREYSSGMSCVPNANCDERFYNNELRKNSYRCACTGRTTKSVNSDGYCYIEENEVCDGDTIKTMTMNTCLPGLVCRDAACVCLYKDHQIFNRGTEKCSSYVGGPCNNTDDCLDPSAECFHEGGGVHQCKCRNGFIQAGRTCDRAYGETCKLGDLNPRCDRFGPLECSIRELCECSDFQTYDMETLRCKGLVGAKCTNDDSENGSFCLEGATCKLFRGSEEKSGLCSCKKGWKIEANRTCSVVPTTTVETFDVDNILF